MRYLQPDRLATLLVALGLLVNGDLQSSVSVANTRQDDPQNTDNGGILVTPDWLANEIDRNPDLRIIDLPLRKTNYLQGHIPNAMYLDWRSDIIAPDRREFYRIPGKAEMERLLSRMGVKPDTTIVLTDNMGNRSAVRMYYTLKYFGHGDVRILDGGTGIWKKSNRDLVTEVPDIRPSTYRIKTTNPQFVVALETVQRAIDNDGIQILDSRPPGQYAGETPGKALHTNQTHARRGHVPTALNIPWSENLNVDGTFKSLADLRRLYEAHGIDTHGEVLTYCNEGLHAAMPWFVLHELLGNPEVHVYDDSMAEWANRDDTPLRRDDDQRR